MQQDIISQQGKPRNTAEEYSHSLSKLVSTKRKVQPSRKAAFFPVKASTRLHTVEEGAFALPLKEASIAHTEHSKTPKAEEPTSKAEVGSPVELREKLQIFVRGLLLPKTLCLHLDPETSVSALKKILQNESGILAQYQHLYIGRNFQLCDLLSIRDHGIQQDQNIELRAGGLLGGGQFEDEQTRRNYFFELADKLGRDWKRLARLLGFKEGQLDQFGKNNRGYLHEQIFKMLDAWWMSQDNPADASNKLRDALRDVGRADLALQVHVPDVPAEIRNRAVYQKALEKGSETVHRTRLMIVGQERVGKTSLMRSLIHESFNIDEASTEGVSTDCAINISSSQSWHCKRGDSTSLTQHELMIGLERERRKLDDQEQFQASLVYQPQASSAPSQTQTIETKPRGTTKKSFIHDEVIEKAVSTSREMKYMYRSTDLEPTLNIWDFAGQDLYYTTHQTFLSSRAIYLVVFNLSQDLDKPVPFPDNAACNDGSGGSVTYRTTPIQYLDFWMQSIYTYTKENYSQKELKQNSPPIFIVGTHRNSVGGDDMPEDQRKPLIKKIFDRIHNEVKDKPYYTHVVSKFYSIENSLEDNRKIQELRKHIVGVAVEEPYMGERIPLNWLTFDDKKGKISVGKPVMTLKQVMKGIEMEDEDEPELLTMLKFYHDLGHIIYFGGDGAKESQMLKDVVILDPHWLINAFKKILTVEPRKEQTVKYRDSWNLLKDEGILEDLLIDLVWKDIREHKQALLDLMNKFDLLCKRFDEEEEQSSTASSTATQPRPSKASYYVPSMLRQRTSRPLQLETIEKNSNVFYVDFKEFLPDGLYHRLVVRALRWSQDLGGRKPDLLYDRASFYVDEHHQFALQMVHQPKRAYIKVSVIRAEVIPPPQYVKPPSADVTCKVKDFVEENLLNLKTMWIERVDYCISVQCPNTKHTVIHFLPLGECMANSAVVCYFEYSQVSIKTDEIQAMFKQKSPKEEASARGDRPPIMSAIFFSELTKNIGKDWKPLARNLQFSKAEIETIEIDHRESVNEQIIQMLLQWRQKRGNEMDEMRKELIDALIKVDRRDLANEVRDY